MKIYRSYCALRNRPMRSAYAAGIARATNIFDNWITIIVVEKVSEINKELGEKLKKRFDQLKAYLDKLADAVVETIQRIVDVVKDAVKKIADALEASI